MAAPCNNNRPSSEVVTSPSLMVIWLLWVGRGGNFLQIWSTESHSIIIQLRAFSYFSTPPLIGQYICITDEWIFVSNFGLETDKLF